MPRCIDADALISDSRICGNCKDYELCDGNIAFCPNASARRAINNAPTVETEPVKGWISVDDRLPEPKIWVMVYIKYPSPVFEIERGIQKMDSIKKMFYDGKSFYCDFGTITYWQPLPGPPKEE